MKVSLVKSSKTKTTRVTYQLLKESDSKSVIMIGTQTNNESIEPDCKIFKDSIHSSIINGKVSYQTALKEFNKMVKKRKSEGYVINETATFN